MKACHSLPQGPDQIPRLASKATEKMRDIPLTIQEPPGTRHSRLAITPTDYISPKFSEMQPISFMSNAHDFNARERRNKSSKFECSTMRCLSTVYVPSSTLKIDNRLSQRAPAIQRTKTISSLKPPAPPAPLAEFPNDEDVGEISIPFSPFLGRKAHDNDVHETEATPMPNGPRTPSTRPCSEQVSWHDSWTDSDRHESIAENMECQEASCLSQQSDRYVLAHALHQWKSTACHQAWRLSRLRIVASRNRLSRQRKTLLKLSLYAGHQNRKMQLVMRGIKKYTSSLTRSVFNIWSEEHRMPYSTPTAKQSNGIQKLQLENNELQALVQRHISLATSQESVINNLRERLSSADGEFFRAISDKQTEISRLQAFSATDAQQLKRLQRKMIEDSSTIRELRKQVEELSREKREFEAAGKGPFHSNGDCEEDLVGRCAMLRESLRSLSGTPGSQCH